MEWEAELHTATLAALEAGAFLKESHNSSQQVLVEEGRDIKLAVDQQSETIILSLLEQNKYPVLAEESGTHGSPSKDSPMWVVDPLDGTMNYKKGIPLCCVSIGLWRGNEPILGVIYDFFHNELFTGVVGQGATLNGDKISISETSDPQKAVLASGFPRGMSYEAESLKEYIDRLRKFKKIRFLGSAALSLVYLACGRVDAYREDAIMLWDVAAGVAIIRAAGGAVSTKSSPRHEWAIDVQAASHPSLL